MVARYKTVLVEAIMGGGLT